MRMIPFVILVVGHFVGFLLAARLES